MTAEQRLDTVEDDLDVVKKLLVSAARYAESANQGLDRLTERFDDLAAAQTNTQARIDDLAAAQDRTQALLDQLGTRFDQLVESQSQAFTRLDRIERALDTLASNQVTERDARLALREDLEILYQGVQLSEENTDRAISQLTERVNQLTERVDQLTQGLTASVQDLVGMIGQLANDAAQDRAETRRIWEYLLHQSGNGSSG